MASLLKCMGGRDNGDGSTTWNFMMVVDLAQWNQPVSVPVSDISSKYSQPHLLDPASVDPDVVQARTGILNGTHIVMDFKMDRPSSDSANRVAAVASLFFHHYKTTFMAKVLYNNTLNANAKAVITPGAKTGIGPEPPLPL